MIPNNLIAKTCNTVAIFFRYFGPFAYFFVFFSPYGLGNNRKSTKFMTFVRKLCFQFLFWKVYSSVNSFVIRPSRYSKTNSSAANVYLWPILNSIIVWVRFNVTGLVNIESESLINELEGKFGIHFPLTINGISACWRIVIHLIIEIKVF